MFTVSIDKECGCFKRSDYQNNKSFESKDEALLNAKDMVEDMNENFCQKHSFVLSEDGKSFNITMSLKPQEDSGCCGGGHCS